MKPGDLIFQTIKEGRGWYFVEYAPPICSYRFATLGLVFPEPVDKRKIVLTMESELRKWLGRYPIPIMVSAFDGKGSVMHLEPVKDCSHLIGFISKESKETVSHWRLVKDEELPEDALDLNHLKKVYHDVPYKTGDELRLQSEVRSRQLRIGWSIVFGWAVVVPAVVIILEQTVGWVGWLVAIYGLWKALVKGLKLSGKWKKSQKEIEQEKEDLEMRHHHYHCKQNPEGFQRLKLENFDRSLREDIRKEAESLKAPLAKKSR